MTSTRNTKPEPCAFEDCGSRRFHIGTDGFTYCDQGHQQSERGTVIVEDTGELVTAGRKSKRKKDSDGESAVSRATSFSGSRAFEHYLLCVQLVLRKQLRWLIDVQGLPDELETLVKDLWALRLQKVQTKVFHDSETETEAPSTQLFSSQSESETTTTTASRSSRTSRRRNFQAKEGIPNLPQTLSLCYIGMQLLRIPVTVADVHKWTNAAGLLYYRASREIPLGMRERLPATYQENLEPQELLQAQALHRNISEMLTLFYNEFGMAVPMLNVPLVLVRWIKALALPLEIFAATQRLARLLGIDFDFQVNTKAVRSFALRYPEARLMALLVVSTKLLLPIDGYDASSQSATDLSALSLNWDTWARLHELENSSDAEDPQLNFQQAFAFNEADCVKASDDTLDDYLDWYENNIATEEVRERGRAGKEANFRRALFKMFPVQSERTVGKTGTSSPQKDRAEETLRQVQSTLQPRKIVEQDLGVASVYRRFRKVEELYGPAKIFFTRAAKLAGLSLEAMVQAAFRIEVKLERFEEGLRKAEGVE